MTQFSDAWGFSKLDVFEACKAKFYYQFIKKLPSGGSPAMERGSKMHENIEGYLNGWVTELIPDNRAFQQAIDSLKAKDFRAEQAMGFDKDWNPLSDWFQKDTWLRVKMDASYIDGEHGYAIDFKSGKYRVPSIEQPELYGIALHAKNPSLTKVTAEFWFLDTGEVYSREYTSDELLNLRKKYEKRTEPIYKTVHWEPTPSNECRWCPYSKTRGGVCKF